MSKTDLWMPLYVGDYLADTGHLTTAQHGAYLLLLMHYWRKHELPDDDVQLAAIAKLPLRIWLAMRTTIQAFFQEGWKHKRVEQELSKRQAIAAKRSEAGKRGGDTTALRHEVANAAICSSMTQSQRKTTSTVRVERGLSEGKVPRLSGASSLSELADRLGKRN